MAGKSNPNLKRKKKLIKKKGENVIFKFSFFLRKIYPRFPCEILKNNKQKSR